MGICEFTAVYDCFKKHKGVKRMRKKFRLRNLLIVAAVLYVGYVFVSTQLAMNKIKHEINVKQQELAKLKDKNQKLQDEVDMSKTDSYIEKLARERLGLVKPGEAPVVPKSK